MPLRPLVALLTDFGHQDPYVGILKGVLLQFCPDATLVDVCHQVPAQDVAAGQLVLRAAIPFFPPGTIFLTVVDPGVGSPRRILCLRTDRHLFVGPDNGLLGFLTGSAEFREARAVDIAKWGVAPISATFHGRDIMAPVAGRLAAGGDPAGIGPVVEDVVRIELPRPISTGSGGLRGEILHIDGFGNLVTNLSRDDVERVERGRGARGLSVQVGPRRIRGIRRTYADVPAGEVLALVGSMGHLEISVNGGDARLALGAARRDPVTIEWEEGA